VLAVQGGVGGGDRAVVLGDVDVLADVEGCSSLIWPVAIAVSPRRSSYAPEHQGARRRPTTAHSLLVADFRSLGIGVEGRPDSMVGQCE